MTWNICFSDVGLVVAVFVCFFIFHISSQYATNHNKSNNNACDINNCGHHCQCSDWAKPPTRAIHKSGWPKQRGLLWTTCCANVMTTHTVLQHGIKANNRHTYTLKKRNTFTTAILCTNTHTHTHVDLNTNTQHKKGFVRMFLWLFHRCF